MDIKTLVGFKITGLLVNQNQSQMVLKTDKKDILIDTYGDCCSETWFADVIGIKSILNKNIISVEDIDLPTVDDGRTRQEHDEVFGIRLTSDIGVCDIILRNSSNGYYGGSYSLNLQVPDTTGWKEIMEDWSA